MVPGISIVWRLILVFLFTLIHELGHWVMFKIICKNNFEFRWEATENKKFDKLFKSKKLTPVFDGKITVTEFSNAYDKASEIQKRKINENKMGVCYPIIEWIRYLYVIKRWFFTRCQLSV